MGTILNKSLAYAVRGRIITKKNRTACGGGCAQMRGRVKIMRMSLQKLLAVVVLAVLAPLTGCSQKDLEKNEATISVAVRAAAHVGSWRGLEAFGKRDKEAALRTAGTLRRELEARIIPYLRDDIAPVLSGVIREELAELRGSKIDPLVVEAIILAANVIDIYVTVPSSTTALTPVQRRILVAFCEGLANGCATYQAGRAPDNETIERAAAANASVQGKKAKRSWVSAK